MADNPQTGSPQANFQESRRDFVKKAGKLAIYTPPAVMLLMRPSTDAIAKSAGGYPSFEREFDGRPPSGRREQRKKKGSDNRFWLWRWLFN